MRRRWFKGLRTEGWCCPTNITPSWAVDLPLKPGRTLRAISVDTAYGLDFEVTPWEPTQATAYTKLPNSQKRAQRRARILDVDAPADLWAPVDGFCCGDPKFTPWEALIKKPLHKESSGTSARSCLRMFTSRRLFSSPDTLPNLSSATEARNSNPNRLWHPAVRPHSSMGKATGSRRTLRRIRNANWQWTSFGLALLVATPGKKPGQWTLSQRSPNGKAFATCS